MAEDRPQEEEEGGSLLPPPETIRAGKQPRKDKQVQPDSLSTKLQVKARVLSDSLYERRASLHKTMGEPHLSSQLPATERKQQYTDLISSPELLIGAIAGAAIIGRDGRLRISKAMVDAFAELSDAPNT